jgi:hypothetical protein
LFGYTIFPGDKFLEEEGFNVGPKEVAEVTKKKVSPPVILIACVDYAFITTDEHHQTSTIFLLNKNGASHISTVEGDIPKEDLSLERHPMGTHAD